ncbi:MAG TPA: response regulator transcription factor [Gemmatimonadales bacterium]|nr:response regulator transcription factor [Gemmatimonadales bacterium]
MIRLLIADDHPIVREGLRRIAADQPGITVVAEAQTADEALARMSQAPVDVMLLDVSMPGPGFIEVLQQVRRDHPTVKVLVLSVHPEDQWAVRALRAGAAGYLTKDHSPEQLIEAIRRVYRGSKYVTAALAEKLATGLEAGGGVTPHETLSDREYEVLRGLGAGLSVKDIAARLNLSSKTVSTYRSRILEKMQLRTNADLVRYVRDHALGD